MLQLTGATGSTVELPDRMQRRAYLREMGRAVPGILAGWSPARAAARVQLVIRDRIASPGRPVDDSLRKGISLGLADVARAAAIIGATLHVQHVEGDQAPLPAPVPTVEVVASYVDPGDDEADAALRIHTSPLRGWRPASWSVASRQAPGADWHPRLARDGAGQLNARFERHAGVPMDAAAWHGWMAVKVAFDAALRLQAGEEDLMALTFEGHKGQPLRFTEDGHLAQPTYRTGPDGRPVSVAASLPDDDLPA